MITIYEPRHRYVVEVADTVVAFAGPRSPGRWAFHSSFSIQKAALVKADEIAETYEWVRVVDRAGGES